MAASTNRALAVRAVRAANSLDFWAKEIVGEMKKQNIELDPFGSSHDGETITLSLRTINNMVLKMSELTREIRRFAAPKGSN